MRLCPLCKTREGPPERGACSVCIERCLKLAQRLDAAQPRTPAEAQALLRSPPRLLAGLRASIIILDDIDAEAPVSNEGLMVWWDSPGEDKLSRAQAVAPTLRAPGLKPAARKPKAKRGQKRTARDRRRARARAAAPRQAFVKELRADPQPTGRADDRMDACGMPQAQA